MGLQCRSTVTWTECVAAMALEDGHMSPSSINMTDPNQQCPGEWMLQSHSTGPRRLCGGNRSRHLACFSATYNTYDIHYSHVCGRVRGYEFQTAFGFSTSNSSIDSYYLSGVSLTHDLLEHDNTSGALWVDLGSIVQEALAVHVLTG